MFWNVPELAERIFLLLDPSSVLHLVQAQVIDKQTFKESLSSKVWMSLIKQSSYGEEQLYGEVNEEQRKDVRALVAILKLLQPEDRSRFLLPLLDLICHRFKTTRLLEPGWVKLNCPCQEDPHKISVKGFLLLEEEVERVFGTTVQTLNSVRGYTWDGFAAVCSRMSRQQEMVTSIATKEGYGLQIKDNKDIQAVSTLLQAHQVSIGLRVYGSVGQEGWEALAKAMKAKSNGVQHMRASREGLVGARREDIKDIWEAVSVFLVWNTEVEMDGHVALSNLLCAEKPEHTWEILEKILDLTDKEFIAATRWLDFSQFLRYEKEIVTDASLGDSPDSDEDGEGEESENDEDEEDGENEESANKGGPQGKPDN